MVGVVFGQFGRAGEEQAVRGELAEPLHAIPELASLAGEFAERAARYPTFLVMGAMSLELAASDLDGSLENLEELCVGYALEAAT